MVRSNKIVENFEEFSAENCFSLSFTLVIPSFIIKLVIINIKDIDDIKA